jgi:hypothetical protein
MSPNVLAIFKFVEADVNARLLRTFGTPPDKVMPRYRFIEFPGFIRLFRFFIFLL